ncbi:hypothetical protein WG66_016096, partial [Moniliophthora roreri]
MAFEGCSNFTINAEQVSNVHGDQTNITYQVQGNLMQQTRREWTRWDDYKYIQPCNVYLT